jgi:hypothetical protein
MKNTNIIKVFGGALSIDSLLLKDIANPDDTVTQSPIFISALDNGVADIIIKNSDFVNMTQRVFGASFEGGGLIGLNAGSTIAGYSSILLDGVTFTNIGINKSLGGILFARYPNVRIEGTNETSVFNDVRTAFGGGVLYIVNGSNNNNNNNNNNINYNNNNNN